MKGMKLKIYPVAIGVLVVGLIVFAVSRLNISVQVEPLTLDPTPPTIAPTPLPSPDAVDTPSPSATPATPTPAATPAETAPSPSSSEVQSGTLRVSNQTSHPIRVALLPQQAATNAVDLSSESSSISYSEPVHWDFAPGEGGARGLILSLPNGGLNLKKGDVLVAFAQDGSRRYWGPFVVGETALPSWSSSSSEWQLTLQNDND